MEKIFWVFATDNDGNALHHSVSFDESITIDNIIKDLKEVYVYDDGEKKASDKVILCENMIITDRDLNIICDYSNFDIKKYSSKKSLIDDLLINYFDANFSDYASLTYNNRYRRIINLKTKESYWG